MDRIRISVLVPTLNNLAYVQLLYRSLRENSTWDDHEFFVYFNRVLSEEESWVLHQGILDPDLKYLTAFMNIGISSAYNEMAEKTECEFLLLMDDDMYLLPGWDEAVARTIEPGEERLWRSITTIEPEPTRWTIEGNFGTSVMEFREARLLEWAKDRSKPTMINHRPPNVVRKDEFLAIGGWSEEFFPGFCGDPDFAAKFYKNYCQDNPDRMRSVEDALVYHFVSKTTNERFTSDYRQRAHEMFREKWGMKAPKYMEKVLKSGTLL